jgi:hypothetical protein
MKILRELHSSEEPMKPNSGVAPAALALFVTVVAITLITVSKWSQADFWSTLETELFSFFYRLSLYIVPSVMVLALIYSSGKHRTIVRVAAGLTAVHALATLFRAFVPRPVDPLARSAVDFVIDGYQLVTEYYLLIPAVLLLTLRFRGNLDKLRLGGLCMTGLFALVLVATFWFYGHLFHIIEDVISMGFVGMMGACAWCAAFRREDVANPPVPLPPSDGTVPQSQ